MIMWLTSWRMRLAIHFLAVSRTGALRQTCALAQVIFCRYRFGKLGDQACLVPPVPVLAFQLVGRVAGRDWARSRSWDRTARLTREVYDEAYRRFRV